MLVSIEGNIGSGKSTIMKFLKSTYNDNIIFVDEPVDEWQNIKIEEKNALEIFYKDQKNNSFSFQILAYITRLRNLMKTLKNNPDKIIIMERSIYTDKYVFAKMLYESGNIKEIEWITYNYWFDTFKDQTNLDYILYVNTIPDICLNRIKKRNRLEESNIIIEYLQKCHDKHKEWLENTDVKILDIDGHQSIPEIQKNVIDFINLLMLK